MSATRQILFWVAMLVAVVAIVVLLRQILLPFVAGMALAYLLNPLANRAEQLGVNRLIAILAMMGLLVAGVVVMVLLTEPIIARELATFLDEFPRYVGKLRALASDPNRPWLHKLIGEGLGNAEQSIGELSTLGAAWLDAVVRKVWSGGQVLISVLSLLVVTPIVACYLTYDWNRMIAVLDNWVPPERRGTVRALARDIDDILGAFLRGQSAVCLILGVFYAVALTLTGLSHGPLIGFAAGLISFIPFLGSLTGFMVATSVAIAQFWPHWTSILAVPAVFVAGQSLSDYALLPYFVGRRINLKPVWTIFALFAFGYLFGFVGLLIAVPVAAAIGVLMRFAQKQYFASSLYSTKPEQPAGMSRD